VDGRDIPAMTTRGGSAPRREATVGRGESSGQKKVQMLYEKPNSCYIFSLAESDLRVLAAGRVARGKGQ